MNNILITGISGFIGSSLANNLTRDNNNVIIGLGFDKHKAPHPAANHMVYGDIRDNDLVRRLIADYEVNIVYHMAAQSIVRICASDPMSAYGINVMGTVSLLEACRSVGSDIKSILVSTSDKSYGHATPPYSESTPLEPRFTYEATKTCQDIVSRSYAHNYGLPVKIARCSNVYGPGDPNMSRIIPGSIIRCLKGEPPVLYNGVHNYIREFVYIDDVIDAFKTITHKGKDGEAYCVGGTGHYKVLDIMELIINNTNPSLVPQIKDKDSKFKEIESQWMDCSKLKSIGWNQSVTFEDGIKNTINHYRKYLEENNNV